ncbi:endonuclease/exonuclease/phosphatase family protein [Niveispirillum sp. KHB5.9]|uniref:endonuclease/exonuclease/phosphatase family protein n=1 Tax=Niveispirillum sp. KHB5.9 TaxID=3400269 RepID=UPI003A8BBCD6
MKPHSTGYNTVLHRFLLLAGTALLLISILRWLPFGWSVPDHLRIGLSWGGLVLGLAALALRRWLVLVPVLTATALNLSLVATSFTPPPPLGATPPLTLLHANVWASNPSMDDYVALAHAEKPDIAVVLERYYFHGPVWAQQLADILPHRLDCAEADCGSNILSRWPLERLGPVTSPWHDTPDRPSYLAARVHRPEGAFTLVTVHLGQPFNQPVQDAQVEWLLDRLAELPGPVILSGDFNAAPWSPLMRRIMDRAGLSRLSATGPTWPSQALAIGIPIDHVLGGQGVGGVSARVLGDVGSDHRPVRVEFTAAAP